MERVIIIGGGASGIVCGITSKNQDNEVIVLERNKTPLKKLLMTGNGKCNYFNENFSLVNYHSQNMEIVKEILTDENLSKVRNFFDRIGIIPKIRNGYYYPFSNQATTVQKELLFEAKRVGVDIRCDSFVKNIEKKNNKFLVHVNDEVLECDKLVLSTGSKAVPKTGSDGMGYQFLKELNHSLVEVVPALVQLVGKGNFFKEWDGVRSEASLELYEDDQLISREDGEVQLTNYGISGICTFNLSHFVSRGLLVHKKEVIKINFVPFMGESVFRFMNDYSLRQKDKNLLELLEGILNTKLSSVIIKQSGLSTTDYYQDLSDENRKKLCEYLSHFPVEVIDTKDFDFCQICNGGVPLTEVNPKTFESNIVSGFYIIGELLDMNGNCGGYNLTECWLTGILAGEAIGGKK